MEDRALITEQSLHAYLEALAAREPTPGGGSAAALVGALAAALATMVANFTRGNKKYAAVAADVEERLGQLDDYRRSLEALVQRDIDAYGAVAAGFAMPRGTEAERAARSAHVQQASVKATEVLFAIADECVSASGCALWLAQHGNPNLIADAIMAVLLAEAAVQGSVATIRSSLGFIKDPTVVRAMRARLPAYEQITEDRIKSLALIR